MQEAKYIEKSSFTSSILTEKNGHWGDVGHMHIMEYSKVRNCQRFNLHNDYPFQNEAYMIIYYMPSIHKIQSFKQ